MGVDIEIWFLQAVLLPARQDGCDPQLWCSTRTGSSPFTAFAQPPAPSRTAPKQRTEVSQIRKPRPRCSVAREGVTGSLLTLAPALGASRVA